MRFSRALASIAFVCGATAAAHHDGAEDEEALIQVWGMGPAMSAPAEKKQASAVISHSARSARR
jgi:hypothetical protein